MVTRPSWKGYLKLSLVSCPVELYNATTHAGMVSFHMIDPKTHHRIQMKPYDPDVGIVDREDLVRGYEIEDGRYVTVTDEDLEHIRLKTTKTLEIEQFVDDGDIDVVFFDTPYFLLPDGAEAYEAYAVIRDAMRNAGKTAVGRLVISHRERTFAISARDRGLLAIMLRDPHEIVDEADFLGKIPAVKTDRRMIEIASKIIEQKSGHFDPEKFRDRYESALRSLVKAKMRGAKPIVVEEEKAESNVVDLMDALRKSLKGRKSRFGAGDGEVVPMRKRPAPKQAARKPAAKKSKAKGRRARR